MDVPLPQVDSAIRQEGFVSGMFKPAMRLLSQLGPPDAGEGLAGWPADEHVNLVVHRAFQSQLGKDRCRVFRVHIPGDMVGGTITAQGTRSEIRSMGLCRMAVQLYGGHWLEARGQEAQRDTAASREEVHVARWLS